MPPKDTRWTQFVPRKVYDKYQDRMEIRLARVKEDHRNDLKAILARITTLEGVVAHLDDMLHGEENDN